MGGKVKANDRDTGENAKSTYNVIEGNDQGVFEIITDAQTQEGILRLKKVRLQKLEVASCFLFLKVVDSLRTMGLQELQGATQ